MKRILALAAMVAFIAAQAFAVSVTTKLAQDNLDDADSLSATADTSDVSVLRDDVTAFRVLAWADSAMIYKTQVLPPGGSTWLTVDTDTTAVAIPENTGDLTSIYAGWSVRVILDGLWSTGKKIGQAYINWTK